MKKITLLGFLMAILTFGAMSQTVDFEKFQMRDFNNRNATTIQTNENENSKRMRSGEIRNIAEEHFVKMTPISDTSSVGNSAFSKSSEELTPSSKIENVFDWGIGIFVEDNSQVMFTQRNEVSFYNANTPYFKSVTFDFLDSNKDVTKSVVLNIPDTTMQVSMLKQFSKGVFNSDSKFEFMVQAHGFAGGVGLGATSCRDTIYIINEDGLILKKIGWVSGARIILDNQASPAVKKLMVYGANYTSINSQFKIDIYTAKTLALEHTFDMVNAQLAYSNGPVLEYLRIEDVPYFYTGNYEKSFMRPDSDPRNPTPEKNNKYVIKLYNTNTYQLVKEIKLNIMGEEDNKWSMVTHGYFSGDMNMKYDLSYKTFNSDDKLEILYGIEGYYPEIDDGSVEYYLVNEDNEILKTIPFKSNSGYNPIKMANIVGESDQYALLGGKGEGIEMIRFMNMPSFEVIKDFPASHEGELLSLAFERVPAKGGYNYVFGLGWAELIDDITYGRVAHYSKDGKLLKIDKIRLGAEKIEKFAPVITSATLSPYWVDTDDDNEYAFFVSLFLKPSAPDAFFRIADGEGEAAYSWGENEYGKMSTVGIVLDGKGLLQELYIGFAPPIIMTGDNLNCRSTMFYKLPFKTFMSGGTGTVEDPYIITNAGELSAVRNSLESHFVLANDIDLEGFSTYDGKGWFNIGTQQKIFTGTFNGNNHTIKNMYIDRAGSYDVGLFGNLASAVIKNVSMSNVNIENGECVGSIVANAGASTIENCHVTGKLYGKTLGGIVGKASQKSFIKACSFEGEIDGPGSNGGIIGSAANTEITLSFSKGKVKGRSAAGITPSLGVNCVIDNCYSTAEINGTNAAAGIVCDSKSFINRTYATGNITSSKAGSIASNVSKWQVGECELKNSVGLSELVTASSAFGRIVGGNNNCILANNYALSTMKIGASGSESIVTSTDAASNNGASKTLTDMNQAFYEGISWEFGEDALKPWRMSNNYPYLWYEFIVRSVSFDETDKTIDLGSTFQLAANIMPATAENKGLFWSSSDSNIVRVDKNGLVTAMAPGIGIITVTTDDGDYTATCSFTVIVPVTSVTLDKTTVDIAKSKSTKLTATINPDNATNKDMVWTSSDIAIATVSEAGLVSAIKVGNVVITVTTKDGGFKATCNVNVIIPVIKVLLDETSLNMEIAETAQLTATVRPVDAMNKEVTWSSSDANIATVSTTGLVTAVAKGRAVITVTTVDGGFKATCDVTVGGSSVDDLSDKNIKIFHANNYVVINSNTEIESIYIYDINGKEIYQGQKISISTSSWKNGTYIVKVIDINKVVKVIKLVI